MKSINQAKSYFFYQKLEICQHVTKFYYNDGINHQILLPDVKSLFLNQI